MRNRDSLLLFDLLRLASAAAVALGHCWMMYDDDHVLTVGSMRVGRSGVAILCAIGGYFAFLQRSGPSLPWLRKRLARVYPPFWATFSMLLLANHWFHHRPTPWSLVISEYAGIGYFTHGVILGVHLWFISLILVCYLMAAVLRRHVWAIPIAAAPLLFMDADVAELALCFLLGGATAVWSSRWIPVLGILAGVALGIEFNPDFRYLAVAGIALIIARSSKAKSPGWVASAAQGSYEFYLLHPIAYLTLQEVLGFRFVANLILGTLATIIGVDVLQRALKYVEGTSSRWFLQTPQVDRPRHSDKKETAAEAAV